MKLDDIPTLSKDDLLRLHAHWDVVAIMTQGQRVNSEIGPDDSNDIRLSDFYPRTLVRCGALYQEPNTKLRYRYRTALEKGDIDRCVTLEDFARPKTRFVHRKPEPHRAVLFEDDTIYRGTTIVCCVQDFLAMGYDLDNMYFTEGKKIRHIPVILQQGLSVNLQAMMCKPEEQQ